MICWETIFDQDQLTENIRQIEAEIELDSFWDQNPNAQQIFQNLNQLKRKKEAIDSIEEAFENTKTGIELLTESPSDTDLINEVESLLTSLTERINTIEIECMLSHEWDNFNCIFSINAGAGGTDAQDWAEMLLRMYSRYFTLKEFQI